MNETKQSKVNEVRTPEPSPEKTATPVVDPPSRPVPSGKSTEMMPDEIFLPDDIDSVPAQQQRANRQESSLEQDANFNDIDPIQLAKERQEEQELFSKMILSSERENLYRDYNTMINDEFEDGKFNPSTQNDFLT